MSKTIVPALAVFLIWPLIPPVEDRHPLDGHRPRITDRVLFDKFVQVLVLEESYEKIGDTGYLAATIRRRRNEWIDAGIFPVLERICLEPHERILGLERQSITVDRCIAKAPCGGEVAGKPSVACGKLGTKPSVLTDGV